MILYVLRRNGRVGFEPTVRHQRAQAFQASEWLFESQETSRLS